MNLEVKLIEYGLTEKEAKLYLAAMDVGASPVQKIAKRAGIHRVAAYDPINALIDKGLISTYEEGRRKMYVASDPLALEGLIEKQQRELENLKSDLHSVIPEFEDAFKASPGKPRVRQYEGLDGIVAINDEILEGLTDTVHTIFNRDNNDQYVPREYIEKLRKGRMSKDIEAYSIYSYSGEELPSSEHSHRIMFNDKDLKITADLAIFKDKIRFVSYLNEMSAIVIEDQDIADTMRTMFKLSWEALENRKSN